MMNTPIRAKATCFIMRTISNLQFAYLRKKIPSMKNLVDPRFCKKRSGLLGWKTYVRRRLPRFTIGFLFLMRKMIIFVSKGCEWHPVWRIENFSSFKNFQLKRGLFSNDRFECGLSYLHMTLKKESLVNHYFNNSSEWVSHTWGKGFPLDTNILGPRALSQCTRDCTRNLCPARPPHRPSVGCRQGRAVLLFDIYGDWSRLW